MKTSGIGIVIVLNHDSLYNESLDSIKAKQIGEIKDLIDN